VYTAPSSEHKIVVSSYSNTETRLAMSTLVVWSRVVQSRDVRSSVFSRPEQTTSYCYCSVCVAVTGWVVGHYAQSYCSLGSDTRHSGEVMGGEGCFVLVDKLANKMYHLLQCEYTNV